MNYDFLKEDKPITQNQMLFFSDVNQKLISLEEKFRLIIQTKEFNIKTSIRTKLISLLDYFNKVIIFPNSKLHFSYQYFTFYEDILNLLNEISLPIEFPLLNFTIFPKLNSIYNEIEINLQSKTSKKRSKTIHQNIRILKNSFSHLFELNNKPYEFPKNRKEFHEIAFMIKDLFEALKLDSSNLLTEYYHFIELVDDFIDKVEYVEETKDLVNETISLLSELDQYKNDVQNNLIINEKIPFQKKFPTERSNESPSRSVHTQGMRKSIHTRLVKIIEEDDQKIKQLQENLSNEVIKNESLQKRKERLKNHYRKKVQALNEQIIELNEQIGNQSQINENEDLQLENQKLQSQLNEYMDKLTFEQKNLDDKSNEVETLHKTIKSNERKIQKLDQENSNQKEKISKLKEKIISLTQENDQFQIKDSELAQKEKAFQKSFNILTTYNTKASNEIQKILKSQEKRLDTFEKMICSQLLTNPDSVSEDILQEYSQIKKIMARYNFDSPEDLENYLEQS